MLVSIIIRTYNEARYLSQLLEAISVQQIEDMRYEVIIVDSGSTDKTLEIAKAFNCRLTYIRKEDFSFGRSLNIGCEAARGQYLVFISGHCVPTDEYWLYNLVAPLAGSMVLSYGRQIGGPETRFSEHQIFSKYFPATSRVPQEGFFCNNANAALLAEVWRQFRFDESLTGLEDMELGKRLLAAGYQIGYVADAAVYHYHRENWARVRSRYEREALALQRILPEIHLNFIDFLRYYFSALWLDYRCALQQKLTPSLFGEILIFRLMQFWGAYRGNHEHRVLSRQMKERYFYPGNSSASQPAIQNKEDEGKVPNVNSI